jgi:Zn-dependent protease with chaperone function
MPILLVFVLTAACLPVDWPAPLVGGGAEVAAAFTATAVGLSLGAAFALRTWVVRALRREPGRKGEVIHVYARLRRLMFFANVALAAACVLVFGWGWVTQQSLVVDWTGRPRLAPFAELAVPLPYFVILFGAWTIYYDAERALHRTTVLGPVNKEFWSRAGYFFHHLRQFGLFLMLPVMLVVAHQSVARFLPETARSDWYRITSVAMIPVLILFMPLLIKPILGLKPMPPGPTRDRLEALAKRLHFRCTDFLLWPTHGAVANAMIVGLLPRVRYVIFTDRILEELPPDEVDAVFGHEVGHAKHGHIWLYAAFLALSMTVLAALLFLIGQQLDEAGVELPKWLEGWLALPPLVLTAAYLFLVFGFLSRRCERQADVYGCRAVSCGNPNCTGHDQSTVYPECGRGLCPTGIRTFVRALERVDVVNGNPLRDEDHRRPTIGTMLRGLFKWLRSWLHSTMSRRVAFLLSLIDNPRRERRFQWRVTVLRWGLIVGLIAALYGLGETVGWKTLLQAL